MKPSPSLLQQAVIFRLAMEQPIMSTNEFDQELQLTLIKEEYEELFQAYMDEEPTENQLKELADLVFVCYQFAACCGWDLDTAMRRVFESNMSKLVDGKPLRRSDGKVLKGPNYQPPILEDLV